jgi:hypothetical protein
MAIDGNLGNFFCVPLPVYLSQIPTPHKAFY